MELVSLVGDYVEIVAGVATVAVYFVRRQHKAAVAREAAKELEKREKERRFHEHLPLAFRAQSEASSICDRLRDFNKQLQRTSIVEFHNGDKPFPGKKASIHITTRDDFPSLFRRWVNQPMSRFYVDCITRTEREGSFVWPISDWIDVYDQGEPSSAGDKLPEEDFINLWRSDGVQWAITYWLGSYEGRSFVLALEFNSVPEDLESGFLEQVRIARRDLAKLLPYLSPYHE